MVFAGVYSANLLLCLVADERFECDFDGCNKIYKNKNQLRDHKKYDFGETKCKECGMIFSTKSFTNCSYTSKFPSAL